MIFDEQRVAIVFNLGETGQNNFIECCNSTFCLCKSGCNLNGLLSIAGQKALIESRCGLEDRLIAKQNVQALERVDVLANNNQANSYGCRQEKAIGSPQPRPENKGQQDGSR